MAAAAAEERRLAEDVAKLNGVDLKDVLDLLRQEQPAAIEYENSSWVFDTARLENFVATKLRKLVRAKLGERARLAVAADGASSLVSEPSLHALQQQHVAVEAALLAAREADHAGSGPHLAAALAPPAVPAPAPAPTPTAPAHSLGLARAALGGKHPALLAGETEQIQDQQQQQQQQLQLQELRGLHGGLASVASPGKQGMQQLGADGAHNVDHLAGLARRQTPSVLSTALGGKHPGHVSEPFVGGAAARQDQDQPDAQQPQQPQPQPQPSFSLAETPEQQLFLSAHDLSGHELPRLDQLTDADALEDDDPQGRNDNASDKSFSDLFQDHVDADSGPDPSGSAASSNPPAEDPESAFSMNSSNNKRKRASMSSEPSTEGSASVSGADGSSPRPPPAKKRQGRDHPRLNLGDLPVHEVISGIDVFQNPREEAKEKLICGKCHKYFRKRQEVVVHIRTHTGEKPLRCAKCEMRFAHPSNLRSHERTHVKGKRFKCPTAGCEMAFMTGKELCLHKRTHNDQQRSFKCPGCSKTFKTKATMLKHAHKSHAATLHFCSLCPCLYRHGKTLRQHIKSEHRSAGAKPPPPPPSSSSQPPSSSSQPLAPGRAKAPSL